MVQVLLLNYCSDCWAQNRLEIVRTNMENQYGGDNNRVAWTSILGVRKRQGCRFELYSENKNKRHVDELDVDSEQGILAA